MASQSSDAALVKQMMRDNQASHALVVSQALHEQVGDLIARRMPRLSKTMREKLFIGYGPFTSFAVRIDIGYALDLFSPSMRRDLHAIRAIRNKFAHPDMNVHFDDEDVRACFRKFSDYKPKKDEPFWFFVTKSNACMTELNRLLGTTRSPLLDLLELPDTSPKKSE